MLRRFFLFLSTNEAARNVATTSRMGAGLVRRFVAGNTLEECLQVAGRLNSQGVQVTLNRLGEDVREKAHADRMAQSFRQMVEEIAARKIQGNISLKPTQLGLSWNRELCESLVLEIARHADRLGNTLEIDMEGSEYTQATLEMYRSVLKQFPGTRIAIQAYLHRTEADLGMLRPLGARVRLVKGAYREPKQVAVQSSRELTRKYARLITWLLEAFEEPAVATHNEKLQNHALECIRRRKLSPDRYKFQFVYGIRRDQVEQRVREGHRVQVYVPFGEEWYPYFMRRLAERPANVWFVAKNLFRH